MQWFVFVQNHVVEKKSTGPVFPEIYLVDFVDSGCDEIRKKYIKVFFVFSFSIFFVRSNSKASFHQPCRTQSVLISWSRCVIQGEFGGDLYTHHLFQPDGVQRGLVGKIIQRFEERGFKLIALKLVHATTEHLEKRTWSFHSFRKKADVSLLFL